MADVETVDAGSAQPTPDSVSTPESEVDNDAILESVAKLEANNARLTKELRERDKAIKAFRKEQADSLQAQEDARNKSLEEQGQWKDRFESLQAQTEKKNQEAEKKIQILQGAVHGLTVETAILDAATKANAFSPRQFVDLFGSLFRVADDMSAAEINPEAVKARGLEPYRNGIPLSPTDFIASLAEIGEFQNLFKANAASGAGTKPNPMASPNAAIPMADFAQMSPEEQEKHLEGRRAQLGGGR